MSEEGEPKYELYVKGSDKPREEGSKWYTGEGKANYVNQDTYDGTFVEGVRSGKGLYTFKKNGDTYEGFYELNKKQGFGKMTYMSGKSEEEEGEAEDEAAPERGGTYLGFYSGGQRDDEGTFTYVNGDIYVGQWKAGKKHGQGTYTYAKDDTKLVGEWEGGKITSGKWVFPDGTFYCGKFRYNKPFGKGVWVFRNGNQLTGEYKQTEMKTEEDGGGEEEGAPQPDPKVWCRFKHGKHVVVQGGNVFFPAKLGV